jgi:hypothetical protein
VNTRALQVDKLVEPYLPRWVTSLPECVEILFSLLLTPGFFTSLKPLLHAGSRSSLRKFDAPPGSRAARPKASEPMIEHVHDKAQDTTIYRMSLAENRYDVCAVQRVPYAVFNLELGLSLRTFMQSGGNPRPIRLVF